MFSRISAFIFIALPLFAVASPLEVRNSTADPCALQCCTRAIDRTQGKVELDLLGVTTDIDLGEVGNLVGISCIDINVVAGKTPECMQNTLCCAKTSSILGLSLGCVDINAGI